MAYNPPRFEKPVTLSLSRNETQAAIADLPAQLGSLTLELISRYPSHQKLQNRIGQNLGLDPDRIVVTAGGDDALDRVLRQALSQSRKKIVTHVPTFEMVEVYSRNHAGVLDPVNWIEGSFPLNQLLNRIDAETALVILVTPNNPTGSVVPREAVLAVADRAQAVGAKLLVDHAYLEFADQDDTCELAAHGSINLVRTFSKAWGLAGLRVGYLIAADVEEATRIRNLAGPFPVSAVSLELAHRAMLDNVALMHAQVRQLKKHRSLLIDLFQHVDGARPLPSQGNFVLVEFSSARQAEQVWTELANEGIGVRRFTTPLELQNCLRVTCPLSIGDYLELAHSLCRQFGLNWDFHKNQLGASLLDETETVLDARLPVESNRETANAQSATEASAIRVAAEAGLLQQQDSTAKARIHRHTRETRIELDLNLYGTGQSQVSTGIGFLDHMLTALTFHSRMDLSLKCVGDLDVDDHHTAEDCAIVLGSALDQALGNRAGLQRFGFAFAPLDEALARTVIDLSSRPWPEIHLQLQREQIGNWACENIVHFFQTLAMVLRCSLHVDVLRGQNDHHRVEAAFKSLALALRQAITRSGGTVPSTKGVL